MKEQLITFDTAQLAKEKGFNEYCNNTYLSMSGILTIDPNSRNLDYKTRWSAPTQSLLQKWLREVHAIFICPDFASSLGWILEIHVNNKHESTLTEKKDVGWGTYEEALEKGLQEALKLIKDGKN